MVKTFHLDAFGYEVEIGRLAQQAAGAVLIKKGGTVVLSTVTSGSTRDFPGFLPLSVDYREQFSAAGKIPGGYYKREGKPTDKEVLTSRLIDRPIRPLFPEQFFNQVQIISTVYSVDQEYDPQILALNSSSLALTISDLPFMGPVGAVEVGRIQGDWVINPTYSESKQSDVRLIVAGTTEGICMVEGSMKGISEDELVDALFRAHEEIRKVIEWQQQIAAELKVPKAEVSDRWNWGYWKQQSGQFLNADRVAGVCITDKAKRNAYFDKMRDEYLEQQSEALVQQGVDDSVVRYIFDSVFKEKISEYILSKRSRVDGRALDQIRAIDVEVGLLPRTHGSALFTRGQTQALVSLTLGGGQEVQRIEGVMEATVQEQTFMLHYNFPPFSVGEVRPLRGPGRREVGHGHLAASAIRAILPSTQDFGYTIRIVSDILESNGSSSMATVCGSVMALMNAGVPITAMVSGIAMGLLKGADGNFAVLSDISGFEDAFGLMDFKVAGTDEGITAIQLDVKHKEGLPRQVFENALAQARTGRLHILEKMRLCMDKPAIELSELVPRLVTVKVPVEKIGAIIGGGGKTIREIIEKTGTSIDIDDDGTVKILASPEADSARAVEWVKVLAGNIEAGQVFNGIVRRIADFGLFVELVPGVDGLVHISVIPRDKQKQMQKYYPTESELPVEVAAYDAKTGRIRLVPIKLET